MHRSTSFRKCEACRNCQPMFPKPVQRSAKTPRPVAPLAPRHACEHSPDHSVKADSNGQAASEPKQQSLTPSEPTDLRMSDGPAETGFSYLDAAMAEARAKYAANPSLLPPTEPVVQHSPTPSERDVEERIDNMVVATALAIEEAQKALAATYLTSDDSICSITTPILLDEDSHIEAGNEEVPPINASVDDSTTQRSMSTNESWTELDFNSESTSDKVMVSARGSQKTSAASNRSWIDAGTSAYPEPAFKASPSLKSDGSQSLRADASTQTTDSEPRTSTASRGCGGPQHPTQQQTSRSAVLATKQTQPSAGQKPKQKQSQGWHTLWSVDYTGKW